MGSMPAHTGRSGSAATAPEPGGVCLLIRHPLPEGMRAGRRLALVEAEVVDRKARLPHVLAASRCPLRGSSGCFWISKVPGHDIRYRSGPQAAWC
jgi:hypothetical protein